MKQVRNLSLNSLQKETIGLLSIGTFLEYFDLMLYVHMAVLLDELFFPKADPLTSSIIAAFTFSSIYILRPFGALIFGYIGDHIGRKPTVYGSYNNCHDVHFLHNNGKSSNLPPDRNYRLMDSYDMWHGSRFIKHGRSNEGKYLYY